MPVPIVLLLSKLGFTAAAIKTAGFFIAHPLITAAVNIATSIGALNLFGKLVNRGPGTSSVEALDGPKQTIRSEIVNARWVVGRARVPGVLCYFGSSNAVARMGLILSQGVCEGIEDKMWVDGELVELHRVSGENNHLVPVSGSKYALWLDVYEYFRADGTEGAQLRKDTGSSLAKSRTITRFENLGPGQKSNGMPAKTYGQNGAVVVASNGNWWRKLEDQWHLLDDLTPSGGKVHFNQSAPDLTTSISSTDSRYNLGDAWVALGSGTYYQLMGQLSGTDWYWSEPRSFFAATEVVEPVKNFPPWENAHKLKGVSWVVVELKQSPSIDRRPWKHIPNLEFLVKGIKIKWPGQTTPKWTENAAAIRYWWETERRGRPATAIHRGDFDAAYTACQQPVDLTGLPKAYEVYKKTPEGPPKRYTINGVVTAGDDVDQVETQMDAAWAGEVIEVGGQLRFRPGVDRTGTRTIDDDDIIEPPAVKPWPSLQERINAVTCEIAQSDVHEWTKLSLPEYVDSTAEARDGVKRSGEIRLAYVAAPIAAGRLQAVNLRRARESLRLELVVKPGPNFERLALIPTDRVKVTNSEYGLEKTRMEVERVRVREDWSLELTLKEDHDDTYEDTLVLPALPPREVNLPDVTVVPAVVGLEADEIAEEARDGTTIVYLVVSWTDQVVKDTMVEVREKPASSKGSKGGKGIKGKLKWTSGLSAGTSYRLANVTSGKTYQIRARHRNRQDVAGEWSQIEHTVGGDLDAPAAPTGLDVDSRPTGFRATWTNPTDSDFAAACVYVREKTQTKGDKGLIGVKGSSKGVPTKGAPVKGSPTNTDLVATVDADYYEAAGLTVGKTYQVWVKAKDQSGNLSAADGPQEVAPTPVAEETARIHLDPKKPLAVNDPNTLTLENAVDGNIYIDAEGVIWNRVEGKWVKSPVDIAGTPGAKFYTVSSWPPPAKLSPPPRKGDIAIVRGETDADANRGVWGEFNGTAWEKKGDLTGSTGEKGPPGAQGDAGDKGNKGDKGKKGPQGTQGDTGPKGDPGDKGKKGPQGTQGNTGPKGTPGEKGLKGLHGTQGNTGPKGESGDKGQKGLQGTQGNTGPKGPAGDKGLQGPQGTQGNTGPKGESGGQGAKGVTGVQGPAGTPGSDGDQVFVYYTNAPATTNPAQLAPVSRLLQGIWTTASGYYWYGNATQVPANEQVPSGLTWLPPAPGEEIRMLMTAGALPEIYYQGQSGSLAAGSDNVVSDLTLNRIRWVNSKLVIFATGGNVSNYWGAGQAGASKSIFLCNGTTGVEIPYSDLDSVTSWLVRFGSYSSGAAPHTFLSGLSAGDKVLMVVANSGSFTF